MTGDDGAHAYEIHPSEGNSYSKRGLRKVGWMLEPIEVRSWLTPVLRFPSAVHLWHACLPGYLAGCLSQEKPDMPVIIVRYEDIRDHPVEVCAELENLGLLRKSSASREPIDDIVARSGAAGSRQSLMTRHVEFSAEEEETIASLFDSLEHLDPLLDVLTSMGYYPLNQ